MTGILSNIRFPSVLHSLVEKSDDDSRYTGDRTNDDKDRAFMSNFTIPTNLSESEQMSLADCSKPHIYLFATSANRELYFII
jgi:hypothetical protein